MKSKIILTKRIISCCYYILIDFCDVLKECPYFVFRINIIRKDIPRRCSINLHKKFTKQKVIDHIYKELDSRRRRTYCLRSTKYVVRDFFGSSSGANIFIERIELDPEDLILSEGWYINWSLDYEECLDLEKLNNILESKGATIL